MKDQDIIIGNKLVENLKKINNTFKNIDIKMGIININFIEYNKNNKEIINKLHKGSNL